MVIVIWGYAAASLNTPPFTWGPKASALIGHSEQLRSDDELLGALVANKNVRGVRGAGAPTSPPEHHHNTSLAPYRNPQHDEISSFRCFVRSPK